MAVAREEIDPAMGGRAAHVDGKAAPAAHPPAPRLWRRGRPIGRFAPNDPATLLITDFSREAAWTVTQERSIDDAQRDMACAGVGALLVVTSEVVIGLVPSEDVQGRRPRGEMQVGHVMTPWGRVPALDWRSISVSRVRHLEEWARNTRATHAFLVEQLDDMEYVRGLLSRAHIERSLGSGAKP